MKTLAFKIIRLLLGLFMVVIGLNKFLAFIEIPHPAGAGGELMDIYLDSGFLKMVGVFQMLGGTALLLNRFVPLGLTLLTAVMFNATVFHLLHDPAGIGGAAVSLLLCTVLVYAHKERFKSLLSK